MWLCPLPVSLVGLLWQMPAQVEHHRTLAVSVSLEAVAVGAACVVAAPPASPWTLGVQYGWRHLPSWAAVTSDPWLLWHNAFVLLVPCEAVPV